MLLQPQNSILRHLSRRYENTYSLKYLYMKVHSGFIQNSQKLERIKVHQERKDKHLVYSCTGVLLSNKKELLIQTTT
jgi:hypothetical protein